MELTTQEQKMFLKFQSYIDTHGYDVFYKKVFNGLYMDYSFMILHPSDAARYHPLFNSVFKAFHNAYA